MSFKIDYWNCAAGLVRKFDYIKEQILTNNLDAFFVAEAEIRSGNDLGFLSMNGYDLVTSKTLNTRGKTRLICFKKQWLKMNDDLMSEWDDIIVLSSNEATFVGIYRGFKTFESETERSNWERLLHSMSGLNFNKPTFIFGDFNVDLNNPSARFYNELSDWSFERGLEMHNPGITRARLVGGVLQESALDILLTNRPQFKFNKEWSDQSDHFLIKMEFYLYNPVIREKKEITFRYWEFDQEKANSFLVNKLAVLRMSESNVENIEYGIMACLRSTQEEFVKKRTLTVRSSNEVVSPKIIRLKNWRNSLRKKWLREKTAANWVAMIRASRKLRNEVRKVRAAEIKSKMKKGPKEFWGEINRMMGRNIRSVEKILVDGNEISDKSVISDVFVETFTNKVNNILGEYEPFIPQMNLHANFQPLTEKEIETAMNRLSNKKSCGIDDMSGFFMKKFTVIMVPWLRLLFNKILESGKVPRAWKIAKITPVWKKGDWMNPLNYRPVSNLCSIAKVFEICILQRLELMNFDNLMGLTQHGFRSKHSTDSAIVELINNISERLDEKKEVAVYSCDLTAAFDLLRKEILVPILQKKGVPDYLTRIIHEYLNNRWGYVEVDGFRSCVRQIKSGCIQGSVLGPLLFNIYTSELMNVVHPYKSVGYADDTYVVVTGDNKHELESNIKNTLGKHFEWLEEIGMVCNIGKTELITFSDDEIKVSVNSIEIQSSKNMKVLGVIIDKKLNWLDHVNKIISKAKSTLYGIRYIRSKIDIKDMTDVIRTHVVSRLVYAAPAWAHRLGYKQREKLRSCYYQVLRTVLRDFSFNYSRTMMCRPLGLESIDTILKKGFQFCF